MRVLFTRISSVLSTLEANGHLARFPLEPNDVRDAILATLQTVSSIQISEVDNSQFRSKDPSILGQIRFVYPVTAPYTESNEAPVALITVRKGLSSAVKRTVLVKELSHILLHDRADCHVTNQAQLLGLATALTASSESQKTLGANPRLQNEHYAAIAAVEILCPKRFRPPSTSIESGTVTVEQVAERFGISFSFAKMITDDFYR